MKILAIDYGTKRVGLAKTDASGILAQGFKTLPNDTHLIDSLLEIIREYSIEKIVIGNPKNMDGSDSKKSQEVFRFAQRLEKKIASISIIFVDELLSTEEANSIMTQIKTKQKKRLSIRDQIAAEIILNRYLNEQ